MIGESSNEGYEQNLENHNKQVLIENLPPQKAEKPLQKGEKSSKLKISEATISEADSALIDQIKFNELEIENR